MSGERDETHNNNVIDIWAKDRCEWTEEDVEEAVQRDVLAFQERGETLSEEEIYTIRAMFVKSVENAKFGKSLGETLGSWKWKDDTD